MRILIAVCGSISAYKSIDIVRALVKEGHQIKVVLSKGAENFVVPQVFRYLGAESVHASDSDFKYPSSKADKGTVLHIELAKWCERLIVCPLSANTLAKIVTGEASTLLTSIFLALPKDRPCIFYPAMNSEMYTHPFVIENFKKLKSLPNAFIFPTQKGILACGDIGPGKLLETEKIIETIPTINPFSNKEKLTILISTGATISPLDPVRFLTNSSSGETGYIFAKKALSLGHKVIVTAGKNATLKLDYFEDFPNYTLKRVITTGQMDDEVQSHFPNCDMYISAAAISDLEFKTFDKKLKKNQINGILEINPTKDILKDILKKKKPGQKIIGFAAETELNKTVLDKKWASKPVDLLVGTKVHNGLVGDQPIEGFKHNEANYMLYSKGKPFFEGILKKSQLAEKIITLDF